MTRFAAICLAGATLLASHPSAAAEAGWRADLGTFRIGLVAQGDVPQVPGASLIRDAFSAALAMPVEIVVARDYLALIDAQASGRLEYAAYSALAYAAASRHCACVEAIAAPVSATGATGARAVVIRRAAGAGDGTPYTVAQGTGEGPGVLAGFASGLHPEDARPVAFATHEDALQAFIDGKADALAGHVLTGPGGDMAGTGTMALLGERGLAPSGLSIVWRGPVVGFGPHAVRASLDAEARTILRGFLAGLAGARPDVVEALSPRFPGGFRPLGEEEQSAAAALLDRVLGRETERPAGE